MTREEFFINVNKLFKSLDFLILLKDHVQFNEIYNYFFTESKPNYLVINAKTVYESQSPRYDNYEQFYDEVIIFIELILPKYL